MWCTISLGPTTTRVTGDQPKKWRVTTQEPIWAPQRARPPRLLPRPHDSCAHLTTSAMSMHIGTPVGPTLTRSRSLVGDACSCDCRVHRRGCSSTSEHRTVRSVTTRDRYQDSLVADKTWKWIESLLCALGKFSFSV